MSVVQFQVYKLVVQSQVSCPVKVGWYLGPIAGNLRQAKVYPDWTCGSPTPNRGGSLQHRRGLNP
jgi:hypothetical protein